MPRKRGLVSENGKQSAVMKTEIASLYFTFRLTFQKELAAKALSRIHTLFLENCLEILQTIAAVLACSPSEELLNNFTLATVETLSLQNMHTVKVLKKMDELVSE